MRTEAHLDAFMTKQRAAIARDLDGDPVFLAENAFSLNYEADRAPGMVFDTVKDYQIRAKAA